MNRMNTQLEGVLEIDHERGVVYFHASRPKAGTGPAVTPFRIQGLGQIQYPFKDQQIDVGILPINELHVKVFNQEICAPVSDKGDKVYTVMISKG